MWPFKKTWIYVDGIKGAGKSTFCSLLLDEPYKDVATGCVRVKKKFLGKGWQYVIKDVPGGDSERDKRERERVRSEFFEKQKQKKKCVFIFFLNASEVMDQWENNIKNRLSVLKDTGVSIIGSRGDKLGDDEKKRIQMFFNNERMACEIFNLKDRGARKDVIKFIEECIKESKERDDQ